MKGGNLANLDQRENITTSYFRTADRTFCALCLKASATGDEKGSKFKKRYVL